MTLADGWTTFEDRMLEEKSAKGGQQTITLPTPPATTSQIPRAVGQGQLVVSLNPSQTPIPAWDHRGCGPALWAPLLFSFQGFLHCLVLNSYTNEVLVRASEARNRGEAMLSHF